MLRNPLDNDSPKTPGVAMSNIFTDDNPKPKNVTFKKAPACGAASGANRKPAPPRIYLIEVINGGKHTEENSAIRLSLKWNNVVCFDEGGL